MSTNKSASTMPNYAFNWKNIPKELHYLAPNKEPVSKGSALDDHLKKLWVANKPNLSCAMLKPPNAAGCKVKGKLESKGYASTKQKYQVRCLTCGESSGWATKRQDMPSLAELVYEANQKRITRKQQVKEIEMEEKGVGPMLLDSDKSVVCKEGGVVVVENTNVQVQSQDKLQSDNCCSSKVYDVPAWGPEEIGHWMQKDRPAECSESFEKADSLKVETNDVPESWESLAIDKQKVSDAVVTMPGDVLMCEEGNGPEEISEIADSEDLDSLNLPSKGDLVKEIASQLEAGDGKVDVVVVQKMFKIICELVDEVNLLKRDGNCGWKSGWAGQATSRNEWQRKNELQKPSFAAVAKKSLGDLSLNDKWQDKLQKKKEFIQQSLADNKEQRSVDDGEDDTLSKESKLNVDQMATSVLRLEAKRKRKSEDLVSVFLLGVQKMRYGEIRKSLGNVGVEKKKLLNMVWRGETLELIVPKSYVKTFQSTMKSVSKSIKLVEELVWENLFAKESKKKTNVEVGRLVRTSSEGLITSSRYEVKKAAEKSSKQAEIAFEQWCKTTPSGREDDSYTLVKKSKRRQTKEPLEGGKTPLSPVLDTKAVPVTFKKAEKRKMSSENVETEENADLMLLTDNVCIEQNGADEMQTVEDFVDSIARKNDDNYILNKPTINEASSAIRAEAP